MDAPNAQNLTDPRISATRDWIVKTGLTGVDKDAFLTSYCERLRHLGLPLFRFHVTSNALHPAYGAVGFNWQHDTGPVRQTYQHRTDTPEAWLTSPFYHMISNGLDEYREKIEGQNEPSRFTLLNEMKELGATDYLCAAVLFGDVSGLTEEELGDFRQGALISWMADAPGGFTDEDLTLIRETLPTIGLVLKSAMHERTAEDLLAVYLGADAGRRVLSGEIQRGSTRWIDAIILYFDLEGFTSLAQRIEGEALIAMLNEYFGIAVQDIEAEGGQVLKFMGDGLMAIFDREALANASDRALCVARTLRSSIEDLNAKRQAEDLPALNYTAVIHAGRVLYGNIGAETRLDFTVIGPEVNLAARIADMHRPLGRRLIISQKVVTDITDTSADLVSLGRYMMRGVNEPQELFTLYEP